MDTGFFPRLPFDQYRSIRAINNSAIKRGERSALHLRHALESGVDDSDTDAKAFGRGLHLALLEPENWQVYPPPINERTGNAYGRETKAWSEYVESLPPGALVLDADEIARIHAARDAILTHPTAGPLMQEPGANEVTAVWLDPTLDVYCKGRIDRLTKTQLIDIKTTDDASPREVSWTIRKWGYHVQAAMYTDGFANIAGNPFEMVLVFVESQAPHAVSVAVISRSMIEAGRARYRRALDRYADAAKTNEWTPWPDPIWPEWRDE